MDNYYIITGLVILLCFDRVWTTITMTKLINRIMSKNYNSYVESQVKLKPQKAVKINTKAPELPNDVAHDVNEAFSGLPL